MTFSKNGQVRFFVNENRSEDIETKLRVTHGRAIARNARGTVNCRGATRRIELHGSVARARSIS